MKSLIKQNIHSQSCKKYILFLAFFWILSITFGIAYATAASEDSFSLMRRAPYHAVSIVGLTAVLFFPLIVSTIARCYNSTICIILLCSVKGFFYGFFAFCVAATFGSGGWLISCILMFSDSVMIVFHFWFWIRSTFWGTKFMKRDFFVCFCCATIIGCFDIFCVSPFVTLIFNRL